MQKNDMGEYAIFVQRKFPFFLVFPLTSFSFLQSADLSPQAKTHLSKVYLSLLATVGACAVGAAVHMSFNVGGLFTQLAMFGVLFAFHAATDFVSRFGLLMAFGALQGASIGPLIEHVAYNVDPAIVTSAFLGTAVVFACFSAAALVAKRRSYLYLGGLLGSCLSLLFWGGIVNLFFRSALFFNVQLYLGLVMFCGYVVFDTQLIVEKHAQGSNDFLAHSLNLFIDFVAIFVRLLIILSRNQKKRRNDSN
jgi:Bax inhibitor 1